ncbi:hypothetical protein ARMGADRAFT_1005110 [Armillaria gallica]|uniref:Uncharacterized protein n=1 Tax=Armillaria gallica TaxID=47427 RepID=A0A2H3EP02_ARMGA|nr:hypothetical protein ARMGADRAFT_1005110 [Armillaria gallica]
MASKQRSYYIQEQRMRDKACKLQLTERPRSSEILFRFMAIFDDEFFQPCDL